jgi:hypothetical protein
VASLKWLTDGVKWLFGDGTPDLSPWEEVTGPRGDEPPPRPVFTKVMLEYESFEATAEVTRGRARPVKAERRRPTVDLHRWVRGGPFATMETFLAEVTAEVAEVALERTGPLWGTVDDGTGRAVRVVWVARLDAGHPYRQRMVGRLTKGPVLRMGAYDEPNDVGGSICFGAVPDGGSYLIRADLYPPGAWRRLVSRPCDGEPVPVLGVPWVMTPTSERARRRNAWWFERVQLWASEAGWGGSDFPWRRAEESLVCECKTRYGLVPYQRTDGSGLVFQVEAAQCGGCGTIYWR